MIRVRLPARRVVSTAAILTVGIFAVPERLLTQELPLAPMRASGQSVTAAYEGWFRDSDGQVSLLVGYFNRNTEEVLDIPVGPDNRIEPGGPDYNQPTHFLPRRAWGVFAIPLPPDFGDQALTWTIVANGQATQVPMSLKPDWEVEPYREPAQGNTPPTVRFAPMGDPQQGPPLGISAEYEVTVNESLTVTLWASDDGQVDPNRRPLEGAPVRIRWSKYRGEGEVVFSDPRPETDETTGETRTTVTVSVPGTYVLRAQANDSSGASGGFQCCWTNAHVRVTALP
ncbi:MAG: hypothetical protein VX471_02500 [Acidobacteriota bacterium]|nr:hypothetical protein [Acidobacteriota bacterium]MCH2279945.1 hypothetical protein [Vicinamibacterales bacterium]MEC7768139.1 hypothetical protein [Acidobacteriota bacterium]